MWLRADPLKAPGASNPPLPLGSTFSPIVWCLEQTKRSGERNFFPLAFSPVDLSHHLLPSNEEAHSLGASYTHQDGNLKLHPLRALWMSGSILFLALKKEVCFFYMSSQLHPAADHIDTTFLLRDTCQLPEGRDLHLSYSQLRFLNLEQFQIQSGSSAHTWRNGCCNQLPPLWVASGVGSGFEPFQVISFQLQWAWWWSNNMAAYGEIQCF